MGVQQSSCWNKKRNDTKEEKQTQKPVLFAQIKLNTIDSFDNQNKNLDEKLKLKQIIELLNSSILEKASMKSKHSQQIQQLEKQMKNINYQKAQLELKLKEIQEQAKNMDMILLKAISQKKSSLLQTLNLKNDKKTGFLSNDALKKIKCTQFPSLKTLSLEKNDIKNEGLKIICSQKFQKLEFVGLDDNGITMGGLNYLVKSQWNETVKIGLYSVKSNDSEVFVNVEKYLPKVKGIYLSIDKKKIFNHLQDLEKQSQNDLPSILSLCLNIPEENIQKQILFQSDSQKIRQTYEAQSKSNPNSIATVMLQLTNTFEEIKFQSKSSLKSKISSKIIFTNMNNLHPRYCQIYKESKQFYEFQDLSESSSKMKKFEQQFKNLTAARYKISVDDIKVQKIEKGSLKVSWSTNKLVVLDNRPNHLNDQFHLKHQQTDYFNKFTLSAQDFEARGNIQFPNIASASLMMRGGLPYYQPVQGFRFGINMNHLEGPWLGCDNNKQQWAVSFHGVRSPYNKVSGNLTVLDSIMSGKKDGTMMKAGGGQSYAGSTCLNTNPHNNNLVGRGIYCTPHLFDAFDYTETDQSHKFKLVLQCRVRPKAIKMPNSIPHYWVINESKDIRPYGIILFTNDQKKLIKSKAHQQIYKQRFDVNSWNTKYKNTYETFIAKS